MKQLRRNWPQLIFLVLFAMQWGTATAERAGLRRDVERLSQIVLKTQFTSAENTGMKLSQLVNLYESHSKTYYRKPDGKPLNEFYSIRLVLRQLCEFYPALSAADLRPLKLIEFRDHLIKQGNSRQTINDKISRIRRMYKWGVEREYVEIDTYNKLAAVTSLKAGRCAARENREVPPVRWQSILSVLHGTNHQIARMTRIQYLTGMRVMELLRMDWEDIEKVGDQAIYEPQYHKTSYRGKRRFIVLSSKVMDILGKSRSRGLVFQTIRGKAYSRHSYRNEVVRACRRANTEPFSPSQLRHNAATHIERRYGIEKTRLFLGHSSAFTTELYIERDKNDLLKIAA